ncbi:hypothetical protein P0R31_37035 [Bradyrhizobium yuanmingense]|uniref:lipase family protein n=1 Tax=Bradyrhizobium yuanmingense TaxID=108015 RepID=UPI0023B92B12|nr:hypothetical protein [Bradyrhizobium yuanmingense]MDF0522844.1 hypothetical protein [Bradyrhizobium yuanmingense]
MRRTAEGLVSLPTDRRLYLVTLSGVELHQNGQPTPYFDDAVREWMQLRSRYRRSVIDIMRQYGADDDTQYFVAGHSLGGAVGLGVSADAAMTSSGRPIDRVVTFGSPVLDARYGPATHWVRVEADGDPALKLLAPSRAESWFRSPDMTGRNSSSTRTRFMRTRRALPKST